MKNLFFRLVVVAIFATSIFSVHAQDYKHSAGIVVGTMEGLSYKGFISDKLAIQADLAFKVIPTRGTRIVTHKASGGNVSTDWTTTSEISGSFTAWTFEANPNLLYQSQITAFDECALYWYAGGGVSLGMGNDFSGAAGVYGKWGVNAIGGLELAFDIPLTLFFDFRPGYGMLFDYAKEVIGGPVAQRRICTNFFDWGIGLGARYCF